MIYSITLNPCLDRNIYIPEVKLGGVNRIAREVKFSGGKGIDASKVLTKLGAKNINLGFKGGFEGRELEGMLINKGLELDFIPISQDTRTNIIIHDIALGTETTFNARGPRIRPDEITALMEKIRNLDHKPSYFILSGSLPPGVTSEVYKEIIRIGRKKGAVVAFDSSGEALKTGLESAPNIIKPNLSEFQELVGEDLVSMEDIIHKGRSVLEMGVEILLVSLGKEGMLMVTRDEVFLAVPPPIKVQSCVGAGDSSLAGFVFNHSRGESLDNCLKGGVAAGTATCSCMGPSICRKEDYYSMLSKVKLVKL